MNHVRRLSLTFVAIVVAALGGAACTSRTLPLPPPEVGSVSPAASDGTVTVRGYALEGASIGVVNDRTLQGTIVTSPADGCESTCAFEAKIPAREGDGLRVWQFFETAGAIEAVVPTARTN